jgi:AAA+ ATPase superfamily predicted ATPase
MKFYNREDELKLLDPTRIKALEQSKMTFMVGRRRIGKTSLLVKSIENNRSLYLFISKKKR